MGSVEMTPYVLTFNGSNLVIKSLCHYVIKDFEV